MKLFLFLILLVSCATTESSIPFEKRKYEMCVDSKDQPTCDGFCYQSEVCTKRFLKICTKKEIQVIHKIEAKFSNKEECHKFFNMNFIFSARKMPF